MYELNATDDHPLSISHIGSWQAYLYLGSTILLAGDWIYQNIRTYI